MIPVTNSLLKQKNKRKKDHPDRILKMVKHLFLALAPKFIAYKCTVLALVMEDYVRMNVNVKSARIWKILKSKLNTLEV